MTEYIQVFSTVDKKDDAHAISKTLLERRLAACAQVIGPITSTFRWKEEIQEEEEWLLIMKTRNDLYMELEKQDLQKALHYYQKAEELDGEKGRHGAGISRVKKAMKEGDKPAKEAKKVGKVKKVKKKTKTKKKTKAKKRKRR